MARAWPGLGLLLVLGCSEAPSGLPSGSQCVRSVQCAPGLACIPTLGPDGMPIGMGVCSNDPTSIVGTTPDAGSGDALVMIDGGMDAGIDAAPPADSGPPPADSGPPPMDSGPPPMDSGPPPMDSGPPPMDSGPPPMDSGPPPMDSGPPPTDSGPADAGTPG